MATLNDVVGDMDIDSNAAAAQMERQRSGYPNSKALRTAGRVVRTLASIHPRLANLVVNRLFFMPLSKPPSAAEQRALSSAERLSIPFQGRDLAAYAWGTGPTVILLHGWASNAGSMRHFVEPLREAGFRVLAFDAPAHGASPGRMTDAVQYGEAIRVAIEQNGPVAGVIAHSFGAMSMLLLLGDEPGLGIKAVVANNPPAQLSRLIDIFADMLGLPESVLNGLRRSIQSRFGRPVEHFSLKNHIQSVTNSGMVIADRNDTLARFEDTQYVASQWPGARLLITDGLGHQGALRDSRVIEEVVSFIREKNWPFLLGSLSMRKALAGPCRPEPRNAHSPVGAEIDSSRDRWTSNR